MYMYNNKVLISPSAFTEMNPSVLVMRGLEVVSTYKMIFRQVASILCLEVEAREKEARIITDSDSETKQGNLRFTTPPLHTDLEKGFSTAFRTVGALLLD